MIVESFSSLIYGFGVLADPSNILYMVIGVTLGVLIGVLPGLAPSRSEVAVRLPSWAVKPWHGRPGVRASFAGNRSSRRG